MGSSDAPSDPGEGAAHTLVRRTAALARLDLDEAEIERLAPEFRRILDAFGALAGVAADAPPATDEPHNARTRPDTPRPSLGAERVLRCAPEREGAYYSVPKTVGGDA